MTVIEEIVMRMDCDRSKMLDLIKNIKEKEEGIDETKINQVKDMLIQ
jgi:hypothetical protein